MILASKIVLLESKPIYTIARTSLLNKLQRGKIQNFMHSSKALQQNNIFPVVKICKSFIRITKYFNIESY